MLLFRFQLDEICATLTTTTRMLSLTWSVDRRSFQPLRSTSNEPNLQRMRQTDGKFVIRRSTFWSHMDQKSPGGAAKFLLTFFVPFTAFCEPPQPEWLGSSIDSTLQHCHKLSLPQSSDSTTNKSDPTRYSSIA